MTPAQLQAISKKALPFYVDLSTVMMQYAITTPKREAAFVATLGHESDGFTRFVESLYYTTPARIAAVWPTRFYVGKPVAGKRDAAAYTRSTAKLANAVYSNRLGNGDEASGDGARYIGRGPMQTTGATNYGVVSQKVFGDRNVLLRNPERLAEPAIGFKAAGIFWDDNGLNALADAGATQALRRKINGGLTGYDDNDRSDLDTFIDWLVICNRVLGA